MKIIIFCMAILLIGMGWAAASDVDGTHPEDSTSVSSAIPAYHNLMFNPELGMNSGSENIITASYLSGLAVNRVVGDSKNLSVRGRTCLDPRSPTFRCGNHDLCVYHRPNIVHFRDFAIKSSPRRSICGAG